MKIQYFKLFLTLLISINISCSVAKFGKYYFSDDDEQGYLNGRVYTKSKTSYEIGKLSDKWMRETSNKGDLLFVNKSNDSALTVSSACDQKYKDYSLVILSESLTIGVKGKKPVNRKMVEIDGREGLLTEYVANNEGKHVNLTTAVTKKEECVYDFSFTSEEKLNENQNSEFDYFLNEFKVLK